MRVWGLEASQYVLKTFAAGQANEAVQQMYICVLTRCAHGLDLLACSMLIWHFREIHSGAYVC
jgi:hypothetical protein